MSLRLRDLLCRDLINTNLVPADGTATLKLPALAVGTYLLDAIARDARGASLGWASFVLKVEGPGTLHIALDRETYAPGQPVRVTARVDGLAATGCTAALRVWDSHGRLLLAEEPKHGAVRGPFVPLGHHVGAMFQVDLFHGSAFQ